MAAPMGGAGQLLLFIIRFVPIVTIVLLGPAVYLFSRPLSPVRNQHFCSPSSVPQTQYSHSGNEKQTFAHSTRILA